MAFITEADALLFGAPTARVCAFLLIKTANGSPPTWVRLWSGVGRHDMTANNIDTQGGTYLGVGELVGMPVLSQLVNGTAERVEFSLSGVDPAILALADAEADTVRAAPVHVALMAFDDEFQASTSPVWVWEGEADVPRVSRQSVAGDDGSFQVVRSMSLSVGSVFTGRRRAKLSFMNGVDQRRRSSDDAFCDRASVYSAGTTRKWP